MRDPHTATPARQPARATRAPRRPRPATGRLVPALLLALSTATACGGVDRLLTVETPSRLIETTYLVPANAALISASAVADFECALGSYIVASGLSAGELTDGSQTAARWDYDRRTTEANAATYAIASCEGLGVYTPINTARFTNDQAVRQLDGWTDQQVPNRQRLIATNAAMAGYSLVLLGEGFCEGVIDVGALQTSEQLFGEAEARFTRAIAAATTANDQNVLNLALVGRARARLNRGNRNGAAEDAARVPTAFVFNATADLNSGRRNNRVFSQVNQGSTLVTVGEAYRALTVGGTPDPRVRVTDQNRLTADQVNRHFTQNKYTSLSANTPIASGVEARLIEAEARGGQAAVELLNGLRARSGVALPAIGAAEQANLAATIWEERRRELFLQGNRWYDVRRGNLAQVPAPGVQHPKGATYGTQRCWPLPDAERLANPNIGR